MKFDESRRGGPGEHSFRGYYDAGSMPCALCGRLIRWAYTMHDRGRRPFAIGSCCFRRYEGSPKTLAQLRAAQVLQEAYAGGAARDERLHGALGGARERQAEWRRARRGALGLVREYRRAGGVGWLPRELFDLLSEAEKKPGAHKRPADAARWFKAHTAILEERTAARALAGPRPGSGI